MPALNPQAGPYFQFAVHLNGDSSSLRIRVYTKAMMLIHESEIPGSWRKGWNVLGLSLPNLENGIYYVQIRSQDQDSFPKKPALLMVIK
jgi:hypothetical protein